MQDSQVKRGMSTNAKLALGLGLALLVAVGGWFGLHLAGAVPGPLSGFMDHGAAGGATGAPQVPLSREPVSSEAKGRLLLVEAVGGGSLSAQIAGKVGRLSGIRGVRAFLLVRQRDGAFVQGVSTGGGRAVAFAAGRPVAVGGSGRLARPGGAALAGVEYAKSHNTAYGYLELTRLRGHLIAWAARPGREGCPDATNSTAVSAGVPSRGGGACPVGHAAQAGRD